MPYLNNDDMDNLFRKASENYELDTSKLANWNLLQKKLNDAEADITDSPKKKKRRYFLGWLFLIPFALMLQHQGQKKPSGLNTIAEGVKSEKPAVSSKNLPHSKWTTVDTFSFDKKEYGAKSEDLVLENYQDKKQLKNPELITKELSRSRKVAEKNERKQLKIRGDETVIGSEGAANRKLYESREETNMALAGFAHPQLLQELPPKKDPLKMLSALSPLKKRMLDQSSFQEDKQLLIATVAPFVLEQQAKDTGSEKNAVARNSYSYAQVLIAPDFTTIKSQKLSGTGTSFGLLIGRRLNKRLAIETGAFVEKKVYYTKGRYFDKSKISYFNDHEIYEVDGICNMITIPLTLRYNMVSTKKSDLFVTAGLSAYLMQKEDYEITYDYYGTVSTGWSEYKNPPKSWLATANLSVGYQRNFGGSFNFRVEPYLRLPTAGVGTGKLSLTSAGIFVGIGKRF